ncbi:MAG TPA: DUF169 domain-containing protein, partial [Chloroflexota bacterium]
VPYGFSPEVPFSAEGHACAGIYTATPEAGARTEQVVPRFPQGKYHGILVAPLARATFEPHVVAIYGNSAQVMRLVQAALWDRGGGLTSVATGRIDCAEIIIRTMLTGEPQYILPCSGDRIFGLTADDEMVFAMPASWTERVLEGLRGTHQGGIRYPITPFMRFTPQFPPQYQRLMGSVQEAMARAGAHQASAPAGRERVTPAGGEERGEAGTIGPSPRRSRRLGSRRAGGKTGATDPNG